MKKSRPARFPFVNCVVQPVRVVRLFYRHMVHFVSFKDLQNFDFWRATCLEDERQPVGWSYVATASGETKQEPASRRRNTAARVLGLRKTGFSGAWT